MTEISKIKIDDNELIIKDSVARNNYLPLIGGNLTGTISITSDIDLNNPPSEGTNEWSPYFRITDISNSENLGLFRVWQDSNNNTDLRIGTWRTIGTTTYDNKIDLKIDNDGTKRVVIGDQDAWRIGLGADTTTAVWPISLGGTGATTRLGSQGAVAKLFGQDVGTSTAYFFTMYSKSSSWEKIGTCSLSDARKVLFTNDGILPTNLGGTGYSSLTDFMQSGLKINKFAIDTGISRSLSIGSNELMVIFWMRATTNGYALTSGYNNTVVKVVDVGGSTSPTIVNNHDTYVVTITNNRNSNLSVMVFGGTLHS